MSFKNATKKNKKTSNTLKYGSISLVLAYSIGLLIVYLGYFVGWLKLKTLTVAINL